MTRWSRLDADAQVEMDRICIGSDTNMIIYQNFVVYKGSVRLAYQLFQLISQLINPAEQSQKSDSLDQIHILISI